MTEPAKKAKVDRVSVVLKVNTIGVKRGDSVEVSPETAARLVADGHAKPAK